MTVDIYLCRECSQRMQSAGLIFKKVRSPDDKDRCEWCGRACAGRTFRIRYEGVVKHG